MTFAFSLAPSEQQGVADLGFMKSCPVRSRALSVTEDVLTTLEWERAEEARIYPAGMRFAMDNTCTDAEPDELIPIMHELVNALPPAPAHVLWMPWGRTPQPEDMAYSMESDLFINACAMWIDPADDVRLQRWVTDSMRKLEPLSSGTRLSDETSLTARSGSWTTRSCAGSKRCASSTTLTACSTAFGIATASSPRPDWPARSFVATSRVRPSWPPAYRNTAAISKPMAVDIRRAQAEAGRFKPLRAVGSEPQPAASPCSSLAPGQAAAPRHSCQRQYKARHQPPLRPRIQERGRRRAPKQSPDSARPRARPPLGDRHDHALMGLA
jgi:hypothetical protein